MVILSNSGDIYFSISAAMPDDGQLERLLPLVGKHVLAQGVPYQRNGTRAVLLQSIEENQNEKLNANAFKQ